MSNLLKNKKLVIILAGAVVLIVIIAILRSTGNNGSRPGSGRDGDSPERNSAFSGIFSQAGSAGLSKKRPLRRLTPEQRAENEREFARMREKIPGNLWIPGKISREEQKKRRKMLRDIIYFGNRVRKGTATREEKKRYFELKAKQSGDKIEFVEYVIQRAQELERETGKQYLDSSIIERSGPVLEVFRKEHEKYLKELENL